MKDDAGAQVIAKLTFQAEIKGMHFQSLLFSSIGVRLRKDRVICVLDTKTYVYDFEDLRPHRPS